MATIDTVQEPKLGESGEPCADCGTPLAADQRYCLNCGTRRGGPRLAYDQYLKNGSNGGDGPPGGSAGAGSQQPGSGRDWTPFVLVGLVAAFGLMLAVGVLIGKGGSGSSEQAAAPVVQVGGTGASTTGTGSNLPTANTSFKSDWPSGKDGYTVEIGTLAKQGTTADQVDAAKSDATSKGASDVGALDSDDYGSLPSGNYVIYSGVYDTKADATKALKPLKSKFPDAQVVQVSAKGGGGGGTGATVSAAATGGLTSGKAPDDATVQASKQDLQSLQNANGADYEQQSRNLPNNIATPGKPPQTDNKPAGAGTKPTVIK
jgi:hypothetical protein